MFTFDASRAGGPDTLGWYVTTGAALGTIRTGPVTKLRTSINAACDKFLQGDSSYLESSGVDVLWSLQKYHLSLCHVHHTFLPCYLPQYTSHS